MKKEASNKIKELQTTRKVKERKKKERKHGRKQRNS